MVIAAFRASRKFRMIFYNFCYYFWGQHRWWTETNIIGNDFFVFYKFPLPQTVLLLPLPYRCSSVAKYACCVNKLRQNVGGKIENDVILWCHKQSVFSNKDHHTPLLYTRIWSGGIQSSSRPEHHQTSARHWLHWLTLEYIHVIFASHKSYASFSVLVKQTHIQYLSGL